MTLKDDLHQLVDSLDEGRAQEALAYLQQLQARPNAPIADPPKRRTYLWSFWTPRTSSGETI